jgi:predicted RNA-binding protein YlqC (UPF0109 family)
VGTAPGGEEEVSDESFDSGSDSSDDYDDDDDVDDFESLAEDDEEDDDAEVGAEGNRIVGALPKGVLEYLARGIVDDPDGVFVEVSEGRGSEVELRLHVSPADMGKVIGRRGRVAQALRQVVAAAGNREGVRASLDIVD